MSTPLAVEDASAQPDLWVVPVSGRRETPHYVGHRDRLRERALAGGLAALPDYEILELHLFRSIPRGDVKPLAKQLLARFGSLAAVLGATPDELKTVKGVGDALALDLKLLHEAALRTAKRWSREQAVQWAMDNSGRTRPSMTSEIDRYCGTPGQACGYKVGHTEINRLRDRAKAGLGAKYDLRVFNDLVVKTGAVPLTVLGDVVDGYVKAGGVVNL